MKNRMLVAVCMVMALALASPLSAIGEDLKPIQLPKARMAGGKPLMDVLKERHAIREYSTQKLSVQVLSDLLWAAGGLNRPFAGRGLSAKPSHTAPAAHNWQEIDIYVATPEGVYVYDPIGNVLNPVKTSDIRLLLGSYGGKVIQAFTADAPVNLIYVADLAKMGDGTEWDKDHITWADASVMVENACLFCTSEGLGTVVRAAFDRPAVAKAIGLRADQVPLLEQPVGHPKK